jgi:hypothetical protein
VDLQRVDQDLSAGAGDIVRAHKWACITLPFPGIADHGPADKFAVAGRAAPGRVRVDVRPFTGCANSVRLQLSAAPVIAASHVAKVPCVDGSLLARVFFTVRLVGCGHVFGLFARFT